MAFRFYIVPATGAGTFQSPRGPKYFIDGTVSGDWDAKDYGPEAWMIVYSNLSAGDDALLVSQPDAFALPFDLDQTLTAGQVTSVQAKLEAINMPSAWVNTSRTWRYVLKATLGIISFMQHFRAFNLSRLFSGAVSLDTTYNALPLAVRNALLQTAQDMNLDTSGITGASTIRQILRAVGQQLEGRTVVFLGQAF